MSPPPTPTGRPEKTMSSRLMTMKFMQRAAISSPLSPASPKTPDGGPPSKRRRISTQDQSRANQSPLPSTPSTELLAFQAAADAEDAKRVAAIERTAAKAGETKWVLSTADKAPPNGAEVRKLRFLTAGYSDIDHDGGEIGRHGERGRRNFGRLKGEEQRLEGSRTANCDSDFSSSDEAEHEDKNGIDSEYDGDDTTRDSTVASGRQPRQPASKDRNARKADLRSSHVRTHKQVKLNQLTSVSGGGGFAGVECHFCGEKGHKKSDCPKKARSKRRREER